MKLSKKIKIALDETRMLALGANVLLGFQFRGLFSERFEDLSPAAQTANGVALALMLVVIGFLFAPSLYHNIVEHGEDSEHLSQFVDLMSTSALLPFALSLGLSIYIGAGTLFSAAAAWVIGILFVLAALFFWYGLALLQTRKEISMQHETKTKTPLDVKVEQMLTEARVILPGVQALLGFQLSVILTKTFSELDETSQLIHALSLALMAAAIILLMTPAAYHRIACAGENTPGFYRMGNFMVSLSILPFALGLAGDFYVAIEKISSSALLAGLSAFAALLGLVGLWYVYPFIARSNSSPA